MYIWSLNLSFFFIIELHKTIKAVHKVSLKSPPTPLHPFTHFKAFSQVANCQRLLVVVHYLVPL